MTIGRSRSAFARTGASARWIAGLGLGLLGARPASAQHAAVSSVPPPWATAAAPLVFRGVTVIDVEQGKRLANQSVVVVGNRIQQLGPAAKVRVPAGARVVEAAGKYLIPGLWDLHVHPVKYVDVAFPLFLANGVTGVRDAGSNVPLATLGQWKREIAAGTRIGPRYLVSGPAIDESSVRDTMPRIQSGVAAGEHILVPPALAAHVVDSLHAAGADFIKFYHIPAPMRFAMAAEARRIGVPFGGHSAEVPGIAFSDSGATFLDHDSWMPGCGGEQPMDEAALVRQCAAVAHRLRQNHTWVVESRLLVGSLLSRMSGEMLQYSPLVDTAQAKVLAQVVDSVPEPVSTDGWRRALQADDKLGISAGDRRLVAAQVALRDSLRQLGGDLPIVLGTDAMFLSTFSPNYGLRVPGFTMAPGLEFLVLTGMPPLEALQTATLNPARALRATDSLGTVAAGKLADLVLLDADPLADIWNTTRIQAVVANGRYYDRAALDGLLAAAHAQAVQARATHVRGRGP